MKSPKKIILSIALLAPFVARADMDTMIDVPTVLAFAFLIFLLCLALIFSVAFGFFKIANAVSKRKRTKVWRTWFGAVGITAIASWALEANSTLGLKEGYTLIPYWYYPLVTLLGCGVGYRLTPKVQVSK